MLPSLIQTFNPMNPTVSLLLENGECFALPTGEMMKLQSLKLFVEDPPRYEFRVSRSLEDEGIVVSE